MRQTFVMALALLAAGLGTEARAQVFTPTYMAPRGGGDVGVYLSNEPGDFAVEGILRRGFGGYDLGFRIGLSNRDDAAFLVGAEWRNPLQLGTSPVDLAFTAGVQAGVGDAGALGFQGGLSIGYTVLTTDFLATPYLHPRIALVNDFGGDDEFGAEALA